MGSFCYRFFYRSIFVLSTVSTCLLCSPTADAVLLNRIGSSSASSLGMAGAGQASAFHPGPQNLGLNPAGLSTVEDFELFAGGMVVLPEFSYTRHQNYGGGTFDAYDDIFPFPELAVGYRIDEHWIVGAECWVPYGLAADLRPVPSQNFLHHQSEIFLMQGAFGVAYQLNDELSLGASLDVDFVKIKFHLPIIQNNIFLGTGRNMGDGLDVGGTFGILWTPDRWRLGLRYSMPVDIHLDGYTQFPAATGLGRHDYDSEVTAPQRVMAGVAYEINDMWSVAFDAQYTDYGANNTLVLDYNMSPIPDGELPLDWENVWGLHAGNSLQMTDQLTWEQGVGYLTYGAPDETMLPSIPDASGFVVDSGVIYDWNPHISTYLSVAYAWGDRDIGFTPTRKAPGEMEASIWLVGAGLHYTF
ncbi:hypothetical protein GF373_05510 [bacterium]|nr:hypothetical protein [bacterium]